MPGVKWFEDNGTPIKEINIHVQVLESMLQEELNLISVTTYALVKRRVKMITAFLCMLGIGAGIALLFWLLGLFIGTYAGIGVLGWTLFFGMLLMLPCNPMLEGFIFIGGVDRLGLGGQYKRKLKVFSKISLVWFFCF